MTDREDKCRFNIVTCQLAGRINLAAADGNGGGSGGGSVARLHRLIHFSATTTTIIRQMLPCDHCSTVLSAEATSDRLSRSSSLLATDALKCFSGTGDSSGGGGGRNGINISDDHDGGGGTGDSETETVKEAGCSRRQMATNSPGFAVAVIVTTISV